MARGLVRVAVATAILAHAAPSLGGPDAKDWVRVVDELLTAFDGAGSEADARFETALNRARDLARAGRSDEQQAWVEELAAQRRAASGDLAGARELLERSIAAHPGAGIQLAWSHFYLAEVLVAQGRLGAARGELAHATRSGDDAARPSDAAGLAEIDGALAARIAGLEADTCLRLGLVDRAAQACDREAAIAAGLPLAARTDSALRRVNLALAIEDFRGVLAIADAHADLVREKDPSSWARFQVRRGTALSELARGGDGSSLPEAEAILRAALDVEGFDPHEAATGLRVLVDIALRRGDLASARERVAALATGVQPVGTGTDACDRRALESALRARLALAEHGDARALAEALANLRECFEASCRAWEREEAPPGGLGFLHWGTQRRVVSELVRLEMALPPADTAAERALEHVVRDQRVGHFARSLPGTGARSADVRAELAADGAVVLVVLPAPEQSHVFLVDASGVVHAECAPRDRLVALAGRAWSGLADPARTSGLTPRLVDDLATLSRELMPGEIAVRVARATHVRVCGLELCGEPPFEILPLADRGEIGLALAISHLPSLPSAVSLARRAAAREAARGAIDLLVLADPDVDPRVAARHPRAASIELDDGELASLRAPEPWRTRVVSRGEARLSVLVAALHDRPAMLTVLAHGVDEPARDLPTGIVLAPDAESDGSTWCEDAAQFDAPAFVALLSCGTGRGRTRLGDDAATHWGGALLAAGSDAVLVARSDLTVRAALPLGAILAEHVVGRGEEPAFALLAARRMLAADAALSDPRERALLRIVGFSHASRAGASAERALGADATPGPETGARAPWLALLGLGAAAAAAVAVLRARGSARR